MAAFVAFQLLFIISQACDYLFDEAYNLTTFTLSDSIIFDNEYETSFQFELKIIDECDDAKCNIFKITQSEETIFAINLISNYLQITHVNNDNLDEVILISNIDQILSVDDNEYHSIYIVITPTIKYVQIDNITYYQSITENPEQYQPLPLSSNISSSLYLNTPSTSTSNGYIKNICINSRINNNITSNISTTYQPSTTSALSSTNYILVKEAMSWMNSELFCQSQYNTHLATIINESDFEEAIDLMIAIDLSDTDVWIGFNDILNEGQWSWIDGTPCTQCNKEWQYWSPEEPNNYQYSSHCARIDARFIEENGGECQHLVTNGSELSVLADSFCRSANQYPFLCNAPDGKYGADGKCENLNDCWQELTYLNDTFVNQDLDDINAVIAFWNDTLFVIGNKYIHYTNFNLSDNVGYNWESVKYDLDYTWDINMNSQQYTQYKSSLYLYVENLDTSLPNLLHFDLETLEVMSYPLDIENDVEDTYSTCLVADDEMVYIIAPVPCTETTNVYTFEKEGEIGDRFEKHTSFTNEKISGAACAMSGDFVYIFGGRASTASTDVIKFNVKTWKHEEMEPPRRILYYFENARAITANNGKIYLYAYYYGDTSNVFTFSRQLVFDPDIDQFETNFIDLNYSAPDSDAQAQLAVYSDNVLLLFDSLTMDNTTSFISYLITDLVSINFASTITSIWPSDGAFDIKYILSDYSDLINTTYMISFQCLNISNPIDALVIFDNNVCDTICDKSMNDCYDCNHGLRTNITFNDSNINQLIFDINAADDETEDILILPSQIAISLKRCHLTISTNQTEINHKNSIIHFQYNLSSNCYEEKNKNYSVSISSESIDDLDHQLNFSITTDYSSHICIFDGGNCNSTTLSMQMMHEQLINISSFDILFESETIDLLIEDPYKFIVNNLGGPSGKNTNFLGLNLTVWILIGSGVFVALVILCFVIYRRKSIEARSMNIKNALVIPIGIAFYEPDPDEPEFTGDLIDLDDGVPADMESCIKLFGDTLNYHIITEQKEDEPKMQWTQNELISHLQQQALYLDNNLKIYDALIVLISGHGIAGNIITSDYKKTPQMRIHRIFSKSGKARNIPRLFVFDCCSGNKERRKTTREMIEFERGKNSLLGPNDNNDSDDDRPLRLSTVHWSSDENNPDFKLVTITAANEGYMSKMKIGAGSYFIQSFVAQIYANHQVGNGGCCSCCCCESKLNLSDMMQNIQNELESAGKQLPEYKCNNGTDKIVFSKNNKNKSRKRKVTEQIELNTTKFNKNVVIADDNDDNSMEEEEELEDARFLQKDLSI